MYVQYYNSNNGKHQAASEIARETGLNFQHVGSEALSQVGIFPISKSNQPFNPLLYLTSMTWDTSTGYAVRSWTATARNLAEASENAKRLMSFTILGRIRQLRRISNINKDILFAADGVDDTVRPARFDKWVDRINAAVTELDTQTSAIDAAATVDAINDIVSPAHGLIKIALDKANPLNLLASDFHFFFSKNYAETDLELFFPSTSTTIAYSSGFAATASVVTADDPSVQIRVASTGVIVDEIELKTQDSSSELSTTAFGFLKYASDVEEDQDVFDYTYNQDPDPFIVTVSGGKFFIDGQEQDSLILKEGEAYRFNQEDSSNSGHPLKIYTDETKYVEVVARVVQVGTPGSSGSYTEYTPATNGTFSYQCAIHEDMGGEIRVWSEDDPGDEEYQVPIIVSDLRMMELE